MKTITRTSLNELAKVMPVLSEEEQREYVGGMAYRLDTDGALTLVDSGNAGTTTIQGPPMNGNTGASFSITGSILMDSGKPLSEGQSVGGGVGSGYTIEGNGVTVDFFKFMADHSDVEYTLLTNSKTKNGSLRTTQEQGSVSNIPVVAGYDTLYHNHPDTFDSKYYSRDDAEMTEAFSNKGVTKSVLYDEGSGKMNTYWEEKRGFDINYRGYNPSDPD